MKKSKLFLLLSLSLILNACAAAPLVTEEQVHGALASIPPASHEEKVIEVLGYPHYVTKIPHERGDIEIWEYQMGNYTYGETAWIVLRNRRVAAMPSTAHDLIHILEMMRVIEKAEFWDPKTKKISS